MKKLKVILFTQLPVRKRLIDGAMKLAAEFDGKWIGHGTYLGTQPPTHDIEFDFNTKDASKFIACLNTLGIVDLQYEVEAFDADERSLTEVEALMEKAVDDIMETIDSPDDLTDAHIEIMVDWVEKLKEKHSVE